MKHTKRIVEGYSMEDAFKKLNETNAPKVEPKRATSRKIVEGSGISDANRNLGLDRLFDAIIRRGLIDSQPDFEPIDSDVAFSGWVKTLAGELFSEYFLDGKEFSGDLLSEEDNAYLEDINNRVAKVANKLLGTSYKLVEEAKSSNAGKRVVENGRDPVYNVVVANSSRYGVDYSNRTVTKSELIEDFIDMALAFDVDGLLDAYAEMDAKTLSDKEFNDMLSLAMDVLDSAEPEGGERIVTILDRFGNVIAGEDLRAEVGEAKSSKVGKRVVEALEVIDLSDIETDMTTSADLDKYASNPVVKKYATKDVFDKILNDGAILELTAEDFGDGHGDPKGYIFAKDGNVAYILVSSNANDFVPSISFIDFKKIVEGKDMFWKEIGFGGFNGANLYVSGPVNSVDDIIADCDEQVDVYFWNESDLYESKSSEVDKTVVESAKDPITYNMQINYDAGDYDNDGCDYVLSQVGDEWTYENITDDDISAVFSSAADAIIDAIRTFWGEGYGDEVDADVIIDVMLEETLRDVLDSAAMDKISAEAEALEKLPEISEANVVFY